MATFARARELCERLGEPPEYLQVMFWLTTVSVVRGELPAALETVEALLSAAEGRDDRPALINAIRGRAMILFFLGRIVDAQEAIERAVEVFNASQEADRLAARAAGQDAGVAMLALMSWVLWVQGQVDGAVNKIAAALERADAVNHAHTHAYAWYYASVLQFCAASRQLLRPTRSAVSPYRSNTDFASGSDCRARSAESARPCWMHRAADSTR